LLGSFDHWQYGADYVVSLLHDHLSELHSTIPSEQWPHTLYLQVDNCQKENKNTTMIRYLGLLVHFGWFKNVQLFSLPTGHTHEDIDQMFSTCMFITGKVDFNHHWKFLNLLSKLILLKQLDHTSKWYKLAL
jgi:hypothetical protein